MRSNPNKVRGRVVQEWVNAHKRAWSLEATIEACEKADTELSRKGLNPAPEFRKAREREDERYARLWVQGCKFPWLKRKRRNGPRRK